MYKIKNTLIYAIRSNDEGVAYVVSAEGCNFFHAGDLNIWHWKDAADNKNAYSLKIYRRQIEKISGWCFDAAMLPLDPRLEDRAPNAIVEFMNTVECRYLFPMHYWNRKKDASVYLDDERLLPFREKICFPSCWNTVRRTVCPCSAGVNNPARFKESDEACPVG